MYTPRPLSTDFVTLLCRIPLLGIVAIISVVLSLTWNGRNIDSQCVKSVISFTFDDGYETTLTKGYPILTKYNFKGTVYVVTDFIGKDNRLNAMQLIFLYSNGWEIASHGVTHTDLTTLSRDDVIKELSQSKRALEQMGFGIEDFAVPYDGYNHDIVELIKQYYVSNKTASEGLNDIPVDDNARYQLKVITVKQDTTLDYIYQTILQAKTQNKLLIFTFHQIDTDSLYSVTSENLEKIVKFTKDQGYCDATQVKNQ